MNLVIGGRWGGQNGIDDAIFPAELVVDYGARLAVNGGACIVFPAECNFRKPCFVQSENPVFDGDGKP